MTVANTFPSHLSDFTQAPLYRMETPSGRKVWHWRVRHLATHQKWMISQRHIEPISGLKKKCWGESRYFSPQWGKACITGIQLQLTPLRGVVFTKQAIIGTGKGQCGTNPYRKGRAVKKGLYQVGSTGYWVGGTFVGLISGGGEERVGSVWEKH